MPYKSEAQRKFFNSQAGKEKLGEKEVEKWNEESKGQKNLPEKVSSKDTWNRAIRNCDLNKNPDDRVHEIVGKYTVQWNKGTGYFEIRKSGKIVGYSSTFENARREAWRQHSAEQ